VTKRFVLLLTLLACLAASCASSEISILITARASGTGPTEISTVVVHVIPTQCWDPGMGCDAANRTIAEINADQPIRVAVHLHNPTPVMVHIVAVTASGATTLYATRCYDPQGIVRDEVLLVPTDATSDADGDGWPNAMHYDAQCRDPDGSTPDGVACHAGLCPASIGADCNDMASAMPVDCSMTGRMAGMCIFPGAASICGDMIDQDCRWNGLMNGNRDEPCGDMDMDGWQACNASQSPTSDMDPHIHPHATGACGVGIDWGCTGVPTYCDADMDGFPSNVDCNDMDPYIHPGPITMEACDAMASAAMCTANHAPCRVNAMGACGCDGVDNNCNMLIDRRAAAPTWTATGTTRAIRA